MRLLRVSLLALVTLSSSRCVPRLAPAPMSAADAALADAVANGLLTGWVDSQGNDELGPEVHTILQSVPDSTDRYLIGAWRVHTSGTERRALRVPLSTFRRLHPVPQGETRVLFVVDSVVNSRTYVFVGLSFHCGGHSAQVTMVPAGATCRVVEVTQPMFVDAFLCR